MTARAREFLSNRSSLAAAVLVCVAVFACGGCAAQPQAAPAPKAAVVTVPVVESGFLTNYAVLRPSDQSPEVLFWRDPNQKKGFRKVFFRPVEVWRGADKRLDDIPESDLQYLADSLYRAMTQRLRQSFELVNRQGPNVLEIEFALTLLTRPKQRIDLFSTDVPVRNLPERTSTMNPATITFVRDCAVEAEFSVAAPRAPGDKRRKPKRIVKAELFDKRRGGDTSKGDVRTWSDVDAVFERWANVMDSQLVALKDGSFRPKLTVHEPGKTQATGKPR